MRDQATVAGMLCPVCRVPLTMSERQNVEIDYCPTCRGVWLDRGELDKIIAAAAEAMPAPVAPPQQGYPPQPAYGGERGYGGGERGYGGERGHYPHKRRKSFLEELFD